MLTMTIVTNNDEQLWLQLSPVKTAVRSADEAPDDIAWTKQTDRELSIEMQADVTTLGDDMLAIYIEREDEQDRTTLRVTEEIAQRFNVPLDQIRIELAADMA